MPLPTLSEACNAPAQISGAVNSQAPWKLLFKKKAVVKLFLLSFLPMRKKVSKERIAFVIYPQANSTSCLRKYGRYAGFYQPSFIVRLRSNIAGYPLIKSSFAQRQCQQCLRTAIPSPIDYESLLIKVKAFLLSFNFFLFYLPHPNVPAGLYYFSKVRKTPLQEAMLY